MPLYEYKCSCGKIKDYVLTIENRDSMVGPCSDKACSNGADHSKCRHYSKAPATVYVGDMLDKHYNKLPDQMKVLADFSSSRKS